MLNQQYLVGSGEILKKNRVTESRFTPSLWSAAGPFLLKTKGTKSQQVEQWSDGVVMEARGAVQWVFHFHEK